MDFVTELNSAVVVDRNGLQKLDTDKMNSALATVYGGSKPVIMVDNAAQFFSNQNLVKTMDTPKSGVVLAAILEQRGVQLTVAEMNTLSEYHTLKNRVLDIIREQTPVYPFAKVPKNWDIDKELTFNSKHIRRTHNSSYTIGYRTLERIWRTASAVWAGYSTEKTLGDIRASGYWEAACIEDNRVRIGCQHIERYELEQVAVKMGWEFPKEPI